MLKVTKILAVTLLALGGTAMAQERGTAGPGSAGMLSNPVSVPSIAEQARTGKLIFADDSRPSGARPKKRVGPNLPIGKGSKSADLALQKNSATRAGRAPSLVFDADEQTSAGVTDPTGAVGPDHFIGAWNSAFRIFDKEGNPLTNEMSLGSLFAGNTLGDPIVFFDPYLDNEPGEPRGRFVITEFDSSPNGINIAVCKGPDPVNDGWWVYTTGFETGGSGTNSPTFPDYTKFSVWADAYYVTANISNTPGSPNNSDKVFALEREKMANGEEAQFVGFPLPGKSTANFFSPQGFTSTGGSESEPGNFSVVYLQDDAFNGINDDHLKVWTFNVDWEDTSNSTVSDPAQIIETEDFISVFDGGSFSNLRQPNGVSIDALAFTIMNQAHVRKFDGYNSAIFNFVVDTDPGAGNANELAGVRWYELRQTAQGEPWEIFQEGTYTAPDGRHAFSASMAMDIYGNIGMAYSSVSDTESLSIRYTGRLNGDPSGEMTIEEELIGQSTRDASSNRVADYVHLSIDPKDDLTFWHIAEYYNPNKRNVVGVFDHAQPTANDVAIIDTTPNSGVLDGPQTISVTIQNYGTEAQSNIPVSYQINGGDLVEEEWSGTLAPGEVVIYDFEEQGEFSPNGALSRIETRTNLANDNVPFNDIYGENVKNDAVLSLDDLFINNAELNISSTDNNHFDVLVRSNYSELLQITVYDLNGRLLMSNFMPNNGNKFTYQLDMSYAASGVYLVKVGEKDFEKTSKILVK
ncbi:T9SS C-terminal target domain-containing protein [Dokdonia sinensis]|uniref:T9SS C-terminal target domain-containing protein n=1 Tax=Dokdonia sinensis TaxID=2479847 RepID=A0A3M0FZ71_9FLAO|nr:T9SS type A sorting domain-containing protein [Dokdonia sinensis]RMB58031.1 T9SS C-terminal target domain-containing protein [Dokdonia sinensis]